MRPTRFGSRPSSASALTLFPAPDSPTRPRVSPGAIVYDNPRTAWTTRRAANSTRRSLTASNGSRPGTAFAPIVVVAVLLVVTALASVIRDQLRVLSVSSGAAQYGWLSAWSNRDDRASADAVVVCCRQSWAGSASANARMSAGKARLTKVPGTSWRLGPTG